MKKEPVTGSQSRLNNAPERLYFQDSYCSAFQAEVVASAGSPSRVVLDRTAFYPTSGGQPHDTGTLGGVRVLDVIDEEAGIVHVLDGTLPVGPVDASIDWQRRFDHMQQHTGQHLLSAVLAEQFGIGTVSFHMGAEASTIDLDYGALSSEQMEQVELRANAIVYENRRVGVAFEDASSAVGLRKPSDRTGTIRIVTIDGLDRSACGGTHVRATGEIGFVQLRSTEKVRGGVRLEFLCGQRAVRRARADLRALDRSARAFSSALDEVPDAVEVQIQRLKEAEKAHRRLQEELATHRGRALHAATTPGERGIRHAERQISQGPFPEDLRSEANGFVAEGKAVFVAIADSPAAVLLASSMDSGVHCGKVLKDVLAAFGGRGGGSPQMAQGSFAGAAEAVLAALRRALAAV